MTFPAESFTLAVFQELRDRTTPKEAADVAAQLPAPLKLRLDRVCKDRLVRRVRSKNSSAACDTAGASRKTRRRRSAWSQAAHNVRNAMDRNRELHGTVSRRQPWENSS